MGLFRGVGRLEGEHFIYVAAFGAFTSVAYDTPQQFKNMFGHLAYVLKGVAEVARRLCRPPDARRRTPRPE